MSELLALGISHKTAPLELRERLALTEGRAIGLLAELRESPEVVEAVALSTCNRTELYLAAADPIEAESAALGALARQAELRPTELADSLYSRRGSGAARHLFRVTAGLDSMIVGEAQIQGQVKRAYERALAEDASGPILNRLFRGALAAGKRARSETGIGSGGLSVPSVAVELAERAAGELAGREVLLIGTGETVELTARALAGRGAAIAFVANRRHDRAVGLAERFGGEAVRFDELPARLERAAVVVCATNSPYNVIEREGLEPIAAARSGGPLLIVDLAVPRDVDPRCRDLTGVVVRDVDDVQAVADRNAGGRAAEVSGAERLLGAEVERFERWLASLEVVPTIAALRERGEDVARRVLAENERRLTGLGPEERERVEAMARAVAGRLLHEPTLRLKRAAEGGGDPYREVAALRELFGLDSASEPEGPGAEVRPLRRPSEEAGG